MRWQVFLLLLVPVAVDGLTHMLGMRDNNAWFDQLTGGRFGDFSVGDSLGTLNWWLRVISGGLFGFAVVRFVYPWIQVAFDESRRMLWPEVAATAPRRASGLGPSRRKPPVRYAAPLTISEVALPCAVTVSSEDQDKATN